VSASDIEVVRQVYDAYQRRDPGPLESLFAPDIEWRMTSDPAPRRGLDGVRASVADWLGEFEDESTEVEELIDAGDGRVVGVVRDRGRGKGSGVQVESRFFHLWVLRDGRVAGFVEFTTREEALEAAAEQAPAPPTQ
jgi:ketosteroid isomerase-like protein